MKFNTFPLIALVLMIGVTLVAMAEPKISALDRQAPEKQKRWHKQVVKIMTGGEYLNGSSTGIDQMVKSGATFTSDDVSAAFKSWLSWAQRRDGDLSLIHFTPDMLTESNKDKFNNAIQGINRNNVIDKLKALELIIKNTSKIDSSIFYKLINPKYNLYHKSDMSIHWLEYFLSNDKIDINYYLWKSLMRSAIQENNFSVAKLLIKNHYKVTEVDFESLQNYTAHVLEDEEGTVDKEKALEALSKIKNLMVESLNPK